MCARGGVYCKAKQSKIMKGQGCPRQEERHYLAIEFVNENIETYARPNKLGMHAYVGEYKFKSVCFSDFLYLCTLHTWNHLYLCTMIRVPTFLVRGRKRKRKKTKRHRSRTIFRDILKILRLRYKTHRFD